ncbi:MAG: tripartite tricarboxylate transporter TctB family protein [Hyphomicrobiaceae bacterium]
MWKRLQGLVFLVLGVGSCLEAWRIEATVRETATFDALGPDRYLMLIGALMAGAGLLLMLNPPQRAANDAEPLRLWPLDDHVKMLLALALFALAMPLVGFEASAFGFFVSAFVGISRWPPAKGLAAAAVAVASLHLVFVRIADVPVPHAAWLN